jgi:coenzyme F420 hydrogenase subunit beta
MWSLDYKKLAAHLADKLDLNAARKVDIPYNRFVVYTETDKLEMDFEPVKGLRRQSCDVCFDFTSELADLSVGSTEWKDDWNTLIVRTEPGAKAADQAKTDGKLVVEPLPAERVELLKKASLGKKKRVLEALGNGAPIADYLVMRENERDAIIKG